MSTPTSTHHNQPHHLDDTTQEHAGLAVAPSAVRGRRWVLWLPGLIVALGAAAATAHGLYEVAVASRVPVAIAWLYPLITDGLALVAYSATARLRGSAARYAWAVVVLAAGLSGLAQAAFLAGDPVETAEVAGAGGEHAAMGMDAPGWLRFGVGAWPAIAAAVVAHLLYLLAAPPGVDRPLSTPDPEVNRSGDDELIEAGDGQEAPEWAALRSAPVAVQRAYNPAVQARVFTDPYTPAAITAADPEPESEPEPDGEGGRTAEVERSGPVDGGAAEPPPVPVAGAVAPMRERAEAAARQHVDDHGALPTVSELETLAGVSRGTAAAALKALRERPDPGPANPAAPFIEITQP